MKQLLSGTLLTLAAWIALGWVSQGASLAGDASCSRDCGTGRPHAPDTSSWRRARLPRLAAHLRTPPPQTGEPHPYLILVQPSGGYALPTPAQPYAYGWFGVAPRQHTITHRGYYGNHWLWPGRLPH